jgi:putative hemolysin
MPGDPFHLEGRRTAPCRAALAAVRPLLSWLSGLRACRRVYEQTQKYDRDEPFERRALEALDIQPRLSDSALIRIPTEGPLIIASNHPHGAVDGLVLASVVRRTRPDVRVLTNHLLSRIPELTELCFYVDPFGGPTASTRSRAGLRAAHLWLRNGGALVVFPAGEVAHRRAPSGQPVDSPWRSTMARLVLTTGGRVLPVFIDGANTRTFYAAGHLHPALRTALLARELLNKRGATVTIRLGVPFAASDLAGPAGDRAAATASIRRAVEELGQTVNAAAATMSESHGMSGPTNTIPAEVGNLPRESCLVESGAFQVFVAGARHIPAALREIGRLRELTYRAIGEGTGRQLDLDSFDDRYLHLFSWDRERKRIVGAYRIGRTDRIMTAEGVDGLYTRTLFRYDERLIARLSPALELGRSFVRAEYQKHLFRTAAALERDRPVRRESSAVPRTIRSGQHQLSVLGQLAPPPDGVSSAESSQPRSRGAGGSHQPASDESSTAAGHPTVG